ncbi:hypothetical protein P7D26_03795 [Lactococcus petauri]|uniref:hypothetical protein n=1 Tax=Lactococcus petauri TaxID=1940789 RepID=UPI002890B438|nr:hypothetical protein [Lactococcus petauri]MDT2551758.1 hypothetical protein [Lactococcus petauri]MDT2581202.1 hypothetical protein [Lactococcus petauri]
MKLEDIEPVAYLLVEKRFGQEFNRLFFAEGIEKSQLQPEIGDTALYTTEQMQEYAKAQAKKVFWNSVKGTSEDRVLLARSIDYAFKEVQDEEV